MTATRLESKDTEASTPAEHTPLPHPLKSIPVKFVKGQKPDRIYFIKSLMKEFYDALLNSFGLDKTNSRMIRKAIYPLLASGVVYGLGELITLNMSQTIEGSEEEQYKYKMYLGTAMLAASAMHNLAEHRITSSKKFALAVANDVVGILFTLTSSYQFSRHFFNSYVENSASLILSLGSSLLAFPGLLSFAVKKFGEITNKWNTWRGSQRSDTSEIARGFTFISNTHFQLGSILTKELSAPTQLFSLANIGKNFISSSHWLPQIKNVPALIADRGPTVVAKIDDQYNKISADYEFNTTIEFVLRDSKLVPVPRHKLKLGDKVYCDPKKMNLASVPVTGKLYAFKKIGDREFSEELEEKDFGVNLSAHNGENALIKMSTPLVLSKKTHKVDLHKIHKGDDKAVLAGSKLDLFDADNLFIMICDQIERTTISTYEKIAVIDQVINSYKNKVVYSAIGLSVLTAVLRPMINNVIDTYQNQETWQHDYPWAMLYMFTSIFKPIDLTAIPGHSVHLMFTLFQMMIPFAEPFLRQLVNSSQLQHLNQHLEHKMQTIDALRVVDACLAFQGYYANRFPKGVVIVSDKTGTLTTPRMEVVGIWTKPEDEKKEHKSTDIDQQKKYFEVFASAFTHSKEEMEPEEHAILDTFKKLFKDDDCLKLTTHLGNNHFLKTYTIDKKPHQIETLHLGLFKNFGGRLTIVADGDCYYLVFCGIPNDKTFHGSKLLNDYTTMPTRTGVLSRDWCIARTSISYHRFIILKNFFKQNKQDKIEKYLLMLKNPSIIKTLDYYCTFQINNPMKKDADKFVSNFAEINVPVIVATGDNHKAAVNIAKVLCPKNCKNIKIVHKDKATEFKLSELSADSTIVFAGMNDTILEIFKQVKDIDPKQRPAIIFSEMSADDKGRLAQFLKDEGHFVITNGDGSNDIVMMSKGHMNIGHLIKGVFAPKVGLLANISDKQVQQLLQPDGLQSEECFYTIFDAYLKHSLFIDKFTPLANSQEKASIALLFKTIKMSFELMLEFKPELAKLGTGIREMLHQHWFGIGFDLTWLGTSFYCINSTKNLPADSVSLEEATFLNPTLKVLLGISALIGMSNLALFNESTNFTTMSLILIFLPFLLKNWFYGFGKTHDELVETGTLILQDEISSVVTPKHKIKDSDLESEIKIVTSGKAAKSKYKPGLFGSCFRKKEHEQNHPHPTLSR